MTARPRADGVIVGSATSRIVGRLSVAATADGLCATAFDDWSDPLKLARKLPPGTRPEPGSNRHIERFAAELARWDERRLPAFTVAIDLAGLPPFIAAVLSSLRAITAGSVVSYGELAKLAGSPRAARAVGEAMRRNPLPLVIPCHRVIAAGGRIGGFSPGVEAKRVLLAHEGVTLP